MATIPQPCAIATAIDAWHEAHQSTPRPHMGASGLGHPCSRFIWLSFRWAVVERMPGRILRLFRRGHREEATVIDDLRAIGCVIHSTGADQARVDLGGHVSGSLDGIIESGLPGAPKKRHVLEVKTHGKKSFEYLLKCQSVLESKRGHWCQMQLYMNGTGIDRALYAAVCKDDDRYYFERIRYDEAAALALKERGQRLSTDDRLPPPISTDPSWYQCKMCPAWTFCHSTRLTKEVNCRTCARSTAKTDGTWHCARWDSTIPESFQPKGCTAHVLHPDLVPWPQRDSDSEHVAVYEIDGRLVRNGEGPDAYESTELLANAEMCSLGDPNVQDMREQLGARVTG